MGDAVTPDRLEPSCWRDTLVPYARPDARRGMVDVATSAVPYLVLTALMYAVLDVSPVLVVALAIPAAGFLLRRFIVFHDCAQARAPRAPPQPADPNYYLQRAHDDVPVLHDARQLSLWAAVLALRLKLYDERSGRLVSFAHARRRPGGRCAAVRTGGNGARAHPKKCLGCPERLADRLAELTPTPVVAMTRGM